MTTEQRERDERGVLKGKLVQKMESYLRAHFDYDSALVSGEAMERLLWASGREWLINRGLPVNGELLAEAVKEAVSRYMENWEGKEQGEDDRSHSFGRPEEARINGYGV